MYIGFKTMLISDKEAKKRPTVKAEMLQNLESQCGIRTGGSYRIVGGRPAMPHSWPWQVLIYLGNKSFHAIVAVQPQFRLSLVQVKSEDKIFEELL